MELTLQLDKQEGGSGVLPITKITNTAKATLEYRPWNGQGEQLDVVTLEPEDTASNSFGELPTARVSLTKTCEQTTVDLTSGQAVYTMEIHNDKDAEAAMQNPFLVDLIPQGMRLAEGDGAVRLIDPPQGVSLENWRTETKQGETALFVFLQGALNPGESVQVQLTLASTAAVATYGAAVTNHVLLGSRTKGVQSQDNTRATSWKTQDGHWPDDVTGALNALDETRRGVLVEMLADSGFEDFGYISANVPIQWTTSSEAALLKTGRGDRSEDTGFTADRLSSVNNDGSMEYRLVFTNLSSTNIYTGISFLDVLPVAGDIVSQGGSDRNSQWSMSLDAGSIQLHRLLANGSYEQLEEQSYRVFYYNQPIENSQAMSTVYADIEKLTFDAGELPDGWSENASENTAAFAVAIKKEATIALQPNQSYRVQYRMEVGELEEEAVAARAWTNTVNNFNCSYFSYAIGTPIADATRAQTLISNSVSATILPEPVQVGGHIWIDKNDNGIWEEGESVADLADYALVQSLLDKIEIRINTFEGTSHSASGSTVYKKSSDAEWETKANYVFIGLDPASKRDGFSEDALYSGTTPNSPLQPACLKGAAPKTYNIAATIPVDAQLPFRLSETTGSGRSRNPADLQTGGAYAKEAQDNNFAEASERTAVSERFFLYPTAQGLFDNTKDIGLVPYRNLIIKKKAMDDGSPIEGARFAVYGPFDDEAAAQGAELGQPPATVTTDKNGEAKVEGLLWYKVYVIVETSAGEGYLLDGATATSTAMQVQKRQAVDGHPAWILPIPGKEVTQADQPLVVANRRRAEYEITATKRLEGMALQAEQFTFELLNEKGETVGKAKNEADGTLRFGPLEATGAGTFTYYVQEASDQIPGIRYDGRRYKVQVEVTWNEEEKRLAADIKTFLVGDDGQETPCEGVVFENSYEPEPASYAPKVQKSFRNGESPAAQDKFVFLLEWKEGDRDGATMPAESALSLSGAGEASFGAIEFRRAGTYAFTIREQADTVLEGFGYEFDKSVWTLKVEVVDEGGTLRIGNVRYSVDGHEDSTEQASFVNAYAPRELVFTPKVRKQLSGLAASTDAFRFHLSPIAADPAGGVLVPENATATIRGEGEASFPELTFRSPGTYTFAITEEDGGLPGYSYDHAQWTLTVVVTEKEGELVATPTYSKPGILLPQTNGEAAIFVNQYHSESGEDFVQYTPAVEKSFTADSDPRPTAKPFSFSLTAMENYGSAVEMPWIGRLFGHKVTVLGQGTAYFDSIRFHQEGEYRFLLREERGRASGYTYDATRWILTVRVERSGGRLVVAQARYESEDGERVAGRACFVNAFHLGELAYTGDTFSWTWPLALILACAAGLIALGLARRKKKD